MKTKRTPKQAATTQPKGKPKFKDLKLNKETLQNLSDKGEEIKGGFGKCTYPASGC